MRIYIIAPSVLLTWGAPGTASNPFIPAETLLLSMEGSFNSKLKINSSQNLILSLFSITSKPKFSIFLTLVPVMDH